MGPPKKKGTTKEGEEKKTRDPKKEGNN